MRPPEPTYVYAFGDPDDNLVKVGFTIWPSDRALNLRRQARFPSGRMLYEHETQHARQVERRAHELLAEFRIEGEWFLIEPTEAISAIKQAAADVTDATVVARCQHCGAVLKQKKARA